MEPDPKEVKRMLDEVYTEVFETRTLGDAELDRLLEGTYTWYKLNEAGKIWFLRVAENADVIMERLQPLDDLQEFHADCIDSDVGPAGIKLLARSRKLRDVHLSRFDPRRIPVECFDVIAQLPALASASIGARGPIDDAIRRLSTATNLRELSIGSDSNTHYFTDRGMEFLPAFTLLERLGIIGTDITNEGLQHVGKLSALRKLSLCSVPVSDEGLPALAPLRDLRTLAIDFCEAPITDAGVESLHGMMRLESLWLRASRITDQTMKWIGQLEFLEDLALDDTPLTDESLQYILGKKTLRRVWLLGTNVTAEGARRLQDSLAPDAVVYHKAIPLPED